MNSGSMAFSIPGGGVVFLAPGPGFPGCHSSHLGLRDHTGKTITSPFRLIHSGRLRSSGVYAEGLGTERGLFGVHPE